jgi:FkbM family methyltransferase
LKPGASPEASRNMIQRARRAAKTIREQGLNYYMQNFSYKLLRNYFSLKKGKIQFTRPVWREINFKALGIEASARLLLNPLDEGFSKEFSVYGFREPLNTFAIFNSVAKAKPVVLDIGGNLGYFPLVEYEAGAEKIIVLEPVPSTFGFLSKTLEGFEQLEPLNVAISDGADFLKLYSTNKRNVTSFSKSMLTVMGNVVSEEFCARAVTLYDVADKYPIAMVRMDIEGYEYHILANRLPDTIKTICVELHVIPPYNKVQAIELLQKLNEQNFRVSVVINEMIYGYYPIVQHFGLKTAYKLVTSLNALARTCPRVLVNPSLKELSDMIPEKGHIHLVLQR